jgi:phage gp36-like protein
MAYCTQEDLAQAYGEDRVAGWSRLNPQTVERAIINASAEIDGYLLSGGYAVPLSGCPANLRKYCIDIAVANLVVSAGMLAQDPGGEAVLEQAKVARRYLEKVAEGKFKIPGYGDTEEEETQSLPSTTGTVRVWSRERMDLRGY